MSKIIIEIDSFLEDLIPEYLDNRKKDIKSLEKFAGDSDFKQIEQLSHKIAGNAGSYGFQEMGAIAKKIEELAEENKLEDIKHLIIELSNHFGNIEIKYK